MVRCPTRAQGSSESIGTSPRAKAPKDPADVLRCFSDASVADPILPILHDWANIVWGRYVRTGWFDKFVSKSPSVGNVSCRQSRESLCQEGEEEALNKLIEARDAMAVIWSSFCHCFWNQWNQSHKLWTVSKWEKESSSNCYRRGSTVLDVLEFWTCRSMPIGKLRLHQRNGLACWNPRRRLCSTLKSTSKSSNAIQFYPFLTSTNNRKGFACICLFWEKFVNSKVMKELLKAVLRRSASAFLLCRIVQRFPCTAQKWLWLGWNRLSTLLESGCHRFTDDF